jgi:molecular chaperone DnaK (HSP70)
MGISIVNVNSHDLGVLGIDPQTREPRRKIVIPRNHPLPSRSAKRFQISKDGQTKIVVQIVEGGTDEGHGVTTIGKCVVTDLPADIKQGTEVVVTFNYLSSGRLEVLAKIPSLKIVANSTIDRASGMTTAELERWKQKIVAGAAFLEAEPPLSENRKAAHPKSVNRPPDAPAKQKTPPAKRTPTQPLASKTNRDNFPEIDFEINEQSGIFLFGDEEAKPKIGSSVLAAIQNEESDSKKSDIGLSALDFLNSTDTGKAKPEPGESALDFLIQTTEPKLRADNSELDDFQIEVD